MLSRFHTRRAVDARSPSIAMTTRLVKSSASTKRRGLRRRAVILFRANDLQATRAHRRCGGTKNSAARGYGYAPRALPRDRARKTSGQLFDDGDARHRYNEFAR